MSKENRKKLLVLHTYHSTGIEGNTLTLPETNLIIDGKTLFAGFPDEMASPSTGPSIIEVKNLRYVMDALKLVSLPKKKGINEKYNPITL